MTTTKTPAAPMMKTTAEWTYQDGRWAISVKTGGRGTRFVGRTVVVVRKDRTRTIETLGALIEDYGTGDVAVYESESASRRSVTQRDDDLADV